MVVAMTCIIQCTSSLCDLTVDWTVSSASCIGESIASFFYFKKPLLAMDSYKIKEGQFHYTNG
jgi:hypothetical protein